jgi:hypothetical protein
LIRLEVLFCFYNKKERGQEDGLQKTMRKWIGHETLFTARCGIIIENAGRNEKVSGCRHTLKLKNYLTFETPPYRGAFLYL